MRFGLSWVLCSAISGGLLGGLATLVQRTTLIGSVLMVVVFAGFGVGAAQWLTMGGRLKVTARQWTIATGCGAFAAMFVHIYFGFPFAKAGDAFPVLVSRFGYDVLLFSVIATIVGGLVLGVPQVIALRYTDINWRAWLLATMLGVLVAWLTGLGVWSTMAEFVGISIGHWPRSVKSIVGFASYWATISIPQAFVMGPALNCAARRSLDSQA